MKPLILGIDPGTTSAVAGINFEGELVFLESRRDFSQDEMIRHIMSKGRPVVVASDKSSTPSFVENLASSMGLEVYEPEKDLGQKKKSDLGDGESSHEIDASASAMNAYNNLQRKLKKVKRIAETREVSLLEASEHYFLDKEIKQDREKKQEPVKDEENDESSETRETRLRRKIDRLNEEVNSLRSEKKSLKEENQRLRSKVIDRKNQIREEVVEKEEISKREAIIKDKNKEIERLQESLDTQEKIIRGYKKGIKRIYSGDILVPKADSVEFEELEDKVVAETEELKEKLRSKGYDAKTVEEIKGLELKNFYVIQDFPDENFKEIIDEYRSSR